MTTSPISNYFSLFMAQGFCAVRMRASLYEILLFVCQQITRFCISPLYCYYSFPVTANYGEELEYAFYSIWISVRLGPAQLGTATSPRRRVGATDGCHVRLSVCAATGYRSYDEVLEVLYQAAELSERTKIFRPQISTTVKRCGNSDEIVFICPVRSRSCAEQLSIIC